MVASTLVVVSTNTWWVCGSPDVSAPNTSPMGSGFAWLICHYFWSITTNVTPTPCQAPPTFHHSTNHQHLLNTPFSPPLLLLVTARRQRKSARGQECLLGITAPFHHQPSSISGGSSALENESCCYEWMDLEWRTGGCVCGFACGLLFLLLLLAWLCIIYAPVTRLTTPSLDSVACPCYTTTLIMAT